MRSAFLALALAASTALTGCSSFAPSLTQTALQFERDRADLVRKEATLPDGLQVVYLEGGRGEPLVLLHGFGGNKDNFTRVARHLTPKYRVIVPDLPGFGESSHPQEASYTYAEQAKHVHDFLQALHTQGPVHLGGNSMGGAVALSYATHYRDEVASLWLLDPAGVPEAPASELRKQIEGGGRNPLLVTNEEEFAQMLAFAMSDPPFIPRAVKDVMAQERIRNQALEKKIFWQIAPESLTADLKGLATPALIVWGAEDRLIHVGTAEMLHGLLPRSQVVVMPHVGHVPMVERPQDSADDYLKFRQALQAK